MRDLNELNNYRRLDWEIAAHGAIGGKHAGCFVIAFLGTELRCIAAAGGGWDHVSVSTESHCPTWDEMSFVHRLFAAPGEVWLQFHVPARQHINTHPFCLHLWRPHHRAIALPPSIFV